MRIREGQDIISHGNGGFYNIFLGISLLFLKQTVGRGGDFRIFDL